ncbi:hypothetical protein [Streptomyces sp. bgisy031]|uniref:hypothetical protein n=1 Tax=Streptomyces sp. bgisy031 TaxID=3413772 RepID=UPI003D7411D5
MIVVGLGGQELVPGRAGALRGGVDASCVEDLPDCGRGDRVAEAGEFVLYPAVAPAAVLLGQAQDELLDGGAVEGLPGRWCQVNVQFLAMSWRCQARSVVGAIVEAWRRRSRGTHRKSVASQIRSAGSQRTRAI